MESRGGFQIYSAIKALSAICLWAFSSCKRASGRVHVQGCERAIGGAASAMAPRGTLRETRTHFLPHNSREDIKRPAARCRYERREDREARLKKGTQVGRQLAGSRGRHRFLSRLAFRPGTHG
ncbi:hypothetical protein EYF80_061272 [Liparis tanakae]|uniref:Uncharacterized protein n=1 Tax=Liparis tanakae TaxID=230148 RepID=A0A4Z2EJ30_9TELE|nr:hypothetical protein EYF80_061272 [Liparis tanakae]